MKKLFKVAAFITVMLTILMTSRRIANYLISSYEKNISYLGSVSAETKRFVVSR